ncbi:MAG TPA: OmpA family protein [Alphaproteobacteria bacterium]|nr:OmpA family protein [Alphaproteobacteria bacterium]
MKTRALLLVLLSGVTLSACESMGLQEYNPFDRNSADPQTAQNVQMRSDTGELTPMPSSLPTPTAPPLAQNDQPMAAAQTMQPMNNDVVMYNDANMGQYYNPGATMPAYSGGVMSPRDSSVTIYSIDSDPQMMSGGQIAGAYDGSSYDGGITAQSYAQPYDGTSGQIFFQNGSSRLGSGDLNKLSDVADQAKFAPVNRITVAGYASQPTQAGSQTVEGHILNLKESMNRSFVVSKELMKQGVPAEKIKAVAWGSTKPTGNEAKDRRVDIIMGEQ